MALLPFLVTHDECVVNKNSPRAGGQVEPLCQGRKQTFPSTPHPMDWYQGGVHGDRQDKGRGVGLHTIMHDCSIQTKEKGVCRFAVGVALTGLGSS